MKQYIRKIAKKIRHNYVFTKSDWIWNILRKPYHAILNFGGQGAPLKVSKYLTIRIPPEYLASDLENYETENVEKLINWVQTNPKGTFLDIGSSMGIMSAIAIHVSNQIQAIAFDSDLNSLKATKNLCQFADGGNLKLIYGLITEKSSNNNSLAEIFFKTENLINSSKVTGMPKSLKYVNIHTNTDTSVPEYSIDEIMCDGEIITPVLIKCDIEGAELLALKGSEKFIERYEPSILLSVHPQILPELGKCVTDVALFLDEIGYRYKILSIDHEEHWWCEKI